MVLVLFLLHELMKKDIDHCTSCPCFLVSHESSSRPSVYPQIETDEDTLWTLEVREANEAVAERGQKFLNW